MSPKASTRPRDPDADKLAYEPEHLDAQIRMRVLEAYYRWTFDLIAPYVGERVLDAGCGIGNFTRLLLRRASSVLAVDLSPENIRKAGERFEHDERVEILRADLESGLDEVLDRGLDTIVCLDVLEHIENDVDLLTKFAAMVAPGGHLLLKVPACPWLYGSVDQASAHFRRYGRRQLREKALAAGWSPTKAFYMNIWGVLPYWLKSRVLKRQATFSRTFRPWQLELIRRVVPMLKLIDRILGPPIGQSLVLVAKRQ